MTASSLDLDDDEFLTTFERAGFGRHDFPHRAHLRMAWLYVRRLGVDGAIERLTTGIRLMAETNGQSQLYHDTLTRAWVYVVASLSSPDLPTFDRFLDAHPYLLEKHYLLSYYSASRLSSPEARAHWVAPDLEPIPGAPHTLVDSGSLQCAIPALPAEDVHRALERVPFPVAIIAARDATRVHGTTVSSVATVARDPALVVACVRPDSRVLDIARAAGGFGISYLGANQPSIATRFADRSRGENVVQFGGIPHMLGPFGAPIIIGGPAWFECRLQDEFRVAEHQLVCGTVVAAGLSEAPPLQRVRDGWL